MATRAQVFLLDLDERYKYDAALINVVFIAYKSGNLYTKGV